MNTRLQNLPVSFFSSVMGLAGLAIAAIAVKFPIENATLEAVVSIIIIELIALAASNFAAMLFTRIDFTKNLFNSNLGYIFLGVHILTAMVAAVVLMGK